MSSETKSAKEISFEITKEEPCKNKHGGTGHKVCFVFETHSSSSITFEISCTLNGQTFEEILTKPGKATSLPKDDVHRVELHYKLYKQDSIKIVAVQDKYIKQLMYPIGVDV